MVSYYVCGAFMYTIYVSYMYVLCLDGISDPKASKSAPPISCHTIITCIVV